MRLRTLAICIMTLAAFAPSGSADAGALLSKNEANPCRAGTLATLAGCTHGTFAAFLHECGWVATDNWECEVYFELTMTPNGYLTCGHAWSNTTESAFACSPIPGATPPAKRTSSKPYSFIPPGGRTYVEEAAVCNDYGSRTQSCLPLDILFHLPGPPGDDESPETLAFQLSQTLQNTIEKLQTWHFKPIDVTCEENC